MFVCLFCLFVYFILFCFVLFCFVFVCLFVCLFVYLFVCLFYLVSLTKHLQRQKSIYFRSNQISTNHSMFGFVYSCLFMSVFVYSCLFSYSCLFVFVYRKSSAIFIKTINASLWFFSESISTK